MHSVPARLLPLTLFPVIQMTLFGFSCFLVKFHLAWATVCVVASGIVLNFTIHVWVHECLHLSDRHPFSGWANLLISSVSGLTFDGYRFHHHNHHSHNNGTGDFSRTWRMTDEGPAPCNLWRYVLSWPIQAIRTSRALKSISPTSIHIQQLRKRIRGEFCAILGLILCLGCYSWKFAALYAVMIYIGWALVSLHNYGQHPPMEAESTPSYKSRWYNCLFFNNGLHYEHHADPSKPWYELRNAPCAPQIHEPYLISPLRSHLKDGPLQEQQTKLQRGNNI
jgi:fatty acid desaturase